jgi:hypothetical protein
MELTDLKQMTDIQEACLSFGQLLGLSTPVPEEVLYAAMEDEDYARNLLLSSRNPQLLGHLLRHPVPVTMTVPVTVKEPLTGSPATPGSPQPAPPGNLQLIGKAAKALIDWGKTGFSIVADEVYERRLAACERCDQLEEAPDQFIYKISLKKGENKRTCQSCGCVVSRKARLVSDTCPLADPEHPGFNRWGEVSASF